MEKHYKDEYEEVIGDQKKKFREVVVQLAVEMKQADNEITADCKSLWVIDFKITKDQTKSYLTVKRSNYS